MRLAFIADGRSEHTQNWLKFFSQIGDEILLLSTFPAPEIPGVRMYLLPGLFRIGNTLTNTSDENSNSRKSRIVRILLRQFSYKTLEYIWQQVRTLDVLIQSKKAQTILKMFQPDVVHALRIQNEGYIASFAKYHPLIISSWGSDFVYTANKLFVHRILTRFIIKKPDAFFADCLRDVRLAHLYGLPHTVPTRCFPGNGGVDRTLFHSGSLNMLARERIILYARSYSSVARIDTLLKAFKIILGREQNSLSLLKLIIPPGAIPIVENMCQKFDLPKCRIQVISSVSREEMAHLLQTVAVIVSPMLSDGTPNSMLEAMSCGAFPVMSDLESIREWISHGLNGLLFHPDKPEELAYCLEEALDNITMRQTAQEINEKLINERADKVKVMSEVREFYQMVAHPFENLS